MTRTVMLRDVCSKIDYGLTASAKPSGSAKFLRITDIEQSHVDWVSVPYCDATEAELTKFDLRTGDVVVARTGASTGRSQWIEEPPHAVFASYLVRFRAGSQLDSRFLGYVLGSRPWQLHVSSVAHGKSAQPNMSASAMADFTFDLPPIAEQWAIAEVLGALDDKIAANTTAIERADQLATTITERSMDGTAASLMALAELTMGSSPPGTSYNEAGEGVPFYQGVRDFGTRFPSRRVWTTAPVRFAEAADTLISVRAPVGRVNMAFERLCLGRGLASARSRTGTPMTLFHQIRAARGEWAPFEAVGTVFGAINKSQLDEVAVPSINTSRQADLEAELAALEGNIASALAENARLAATRDELLPLLMSGRVTVRDAERTVEAAT